MGSSIPIKCQYSPVSWGCRIHQLHLYRGIRLPPNGFPGYDIKPSGGEDPVLEV